MRIVHETNYTRRVSNNFDDGQLRILRIQIVEYDGHVEKEYNWKFAH